MASLSSRRIANSITWTLNLTGRSRTLALSFISTDRVRHRNHPSQQHHHRHRSEKRSFSTQPHIRQEAAQPKESAAAPTKFAQSKASPKIVSTPRSPLPAVDTVRNEVARLSQEPIRELTKEGLSDNPPTIADEDGQVDWTTSFHGLSAVAFPKEAQAVLMQPIPVEDIEIKAEGLIYLPEIKYRRILNKAFGPGAWGLAPRGETLVTAKSVTREYALVVHGRLVSIARGEQDYFDKDGIPTAVEGCKSNALMRCCKDLGIASELWDPRFIKQYFKEHTKEVWVEHVVTKKRKKMVMRKDDEAKYPFKETKSGASGAF